MARRSKNPWILADGDLDKECIKEEVQSCSKALASDKTSELLDGSKRFYDLIMGVWSLDTSLAIDAAEVVCDTVRETGGLDCMLNLLSTSDASLRLQVSKAVEQIMTARNRHFIAGHKQFKELVEVSRNRDSLEALRCGTGILENLFKESKDTCHHLIRSSALEGILFGCRSSDCTVLQHCAAALANCAMYGGSKCQISMVRKHADHWLFPLAFSNDNVVKYYALLAIAFLAANVELEAQVAKSGTLDLVLPFLQSQDPEEFPKMCHNHAHGRSADWLQQLVPLLVCGNEQARSLSAFHFAMEAGIKKKQQRLQVFSEIDAINHLQESAKMGSQLTARLCCQALSICSASLPAYQCWDAMNWTPTCVSAWVSDIGLKAVAPAFIEHLVTGNILLNLALEDMKELGFSSQLQSRWFLEQICKLRCQVDVSHLDHDNICKWLMGISKDLAVYRVDFIRGGVTQSLLPHLTESALQELGIRKSLDRLKILLALEDFSHSKDLPDSAHPQLASPVHRHRYDVFISYRRSTGSQLASLLKVHLQVRGLSAFLDVEELGSGKFDEAILTTISRSSNFVLILSQGALDRCQGDTSMQDWVHREVVCALESGVHVIPILDPEFRWPSKSEIPDDLQQVCALNGISWSHEYQDASVDKLISFLHLQGAMPLKRRSYSLREQNTLK